MIILKKIKKVLTSWNYFHFFLDLTFFVFLLLSFRYQFLLLSYKEWGDESDTIVTARLMASGLRLYSEIFQPHGPLIYLPGLCLEKINFFGVRSHRVFIAVLQIISIYLLYLSPIIQNTQIRVRQIFLVLLISIILFCYPKFYSYTYVYQNVVGLFLIIILAQHILPSLFCEEKFRSKNIFLGNFLLGLLPFFGISYIPATFLFFICTIRKSTILESLIGLILAGFFGLFFIFHFASFKGFFAYHIYLNIFVSPLYVSSTFYPTSFLDSIINIFKALTTNFSAVISLLWFCIFIINYFKSEVLFRWEVLRSWRVILLAIGILSLLTRGSGFHALPYYYASLVLFMVFIKNIKIINKPISFCFAPLILFIFFKLSFFYESDKAKFILNKLHVTTDFSNIVKAVTRPNEKIAAYSWQPYEYIVSERMPISGAFVYMPWQAMYNENSILSSRIDPCADLKLYKPKVLMVDKLNVFGRYSWETYGSCIQNELNFHYIQLSNNPYYLRKDIYQKCLKENNCNIKSIK